MGIQRTWIPVHHRCTVTISHINSKQFWWFSSFIKCHRASVLCGSQYKCSGGAHAPQPNQNGTATAEITLFGRVARQIIGKPVVALLCSWSKNQHGSSGP